MRIFDESEIGKILRHASSLSASEKSEPGLGLTIEELHAIGRASGIDPVDIDRAIEELQGSSGDRRTSWWGGPTRYERTIVVDGEMDAEAWERIVTAVRSAFHNPGTITTRGSIREWTSTSDGTSTYHVSVSSANGRSRIRLFWNNEHQGIPAFVPVLVGALFTLPIAIDSGLLGIPAWLTIVGLLFMGCRFFLDRYIRSKESQFDNLAATMKRIIQPPEVDGTAISDREVKSGRATRDTAVGGDARAPEAGESGSSDHASRESASISRNKTGPALDPEDLEAGPEAESSTVRRDRTRG